MPKRALALDLGSSSVRAIVFETAGPREVVPVPGALARRPRHLVSSEPGQATFDADDYLADLVACVDELHSNGALEGVTDICLDSQWHSVMAIGPGGRPLTDVVSWADTRPRRPWPATTPAELESLRQRTGCAFASMYWTWRLPWLRSALGSAAEQFLGLSEYVGLKLLDDPSMSVSIASGTGLLATESLTWDEEAVRLAGASPGVLPPLARAGWEGRLGNVWRGRWPELATARWHAALGDGAAANLGVGCDVADRAAITVGTSAAVRAIRPAPDRSALPAGLWRYCVDDERALIGAAFSSGGELYAWALALWEGTAGTADASDGAVGGGAAGVATKLNFGREVPIAPGSEGVLVLPWQAGTRPPEAAVPAGMGAVLGLGLGHTGPMWCLLQSRPFASSWPEGWRSSRPILPSHWRWSLTVAQWSARSGGSSAWQRRSAGRRSSRASPRRRRVERRPRRLEWTWTVPGSSPTWSNRRRKTSPHWRWRASDGPSTTRGCCRLSQTGEAEATDWRPCAQDGGEARYECDRARDPGVKDLVRKTLVPKTLVPRTLVPRTLVPRPCLSSWYVAHC